MGFSATSAEEVYRYALRKDDSERFLTDRFGLSIVFVNDNSPACEEFLSRYFVDVCHRTAHRIRFIFFANLPPQNVAQEANRGVVNGIFNLWRQRRRGFPRSSTPEDITWNNKLPPALTPILFPEETHIRMEGKRDTHSAVSGYGENIHFAQHLGIAGDMPCFVLFTDIGSKRIDMLPVRNLSPEEMYEILSGWIDDYYKQNRRTLDKWEDIEKEVLAASRRIQSSLQSIEAWQNRGRYTWQQLAAVCNAKERLEHAPFNSETDWKQFYNDFRYEFNINNYLLQYEKSMAQIKQHNEIRSHLDTLINRLQEAKDADAVWNEMSALRDKHKDVLGSSCTSTLNLVLDEIKTCRDQIKNPAHALFKWISEIIERRPSLDKFKQVRWTWKSVPNGAVAPLREKYQFIIELLNHFSLSHNVEQYTSGILDSFAQYLGVDAHSSEWQGETLTYRTQLCDFLHWAQATAPEWVLKQLPDMTLNNFFEAGAQSQETLQSDNPIRTALQAEQEQHQQTQSLLLQQYEAIAKRCALTIHDCLKQERMKYPEVPYERALIYGNLLTQISQKRDELEAQVYAQSAAAFPNVAPLDPRQVDQLHHALNEYEAVVQEIVYPYQQDSRIETIEIDSPIADRLLAFPHSGDESIDESKFAKHKISSVLNANETLKKKKEQDLKEEPHWTPAAVLAECLLEIFKGDQLQARLESLLPTNLKGELPYRVREALLHENAIVFLNKLDDQELDNLLQTLDQKNINPDPKSLPKPRMRDGKIGRILRRVGADTRPPLMGQEAVSRFLIKLTSETIAAMSLEEVRQHGNDLRIKLEQYFKQFLTLHGPLALDEDDQSNLGGKTLGELTSHLISTLKKANAATPLLQEDERWQKVVEKIHTARQQRTWLDSIIRACEDIVSKRGNYSGPANAFSHHNEIPVSELKESLLRFSNSALIIVEALKQAELYPICLRFATILPDSLHGCRFEFDSDPSSEQREIVAFSNLPPVILGMHADFFKNLYRRTMFMFPLSNPVRIDPLVAFATSD